MNYQDFRKQQPLKIKMLIKWYQIKTMALAAIGRCHHDAVVGKLGSGQGMCLYCGKEVSDE